MVRSGFQVPASQLASIYHERREIENGYGELKTRLRGAEFILRDLQHLAAGHIMRVPRLTSDPPGGFAGGAGAVGGGCRVGNAHLGRVVLEHLAQLPASPVQA